MSRHESLIAEGREVSRSLPTEQYVIIATLLDILERELDKNEN